jgi:hypothetical protein
MTRRTLLSAACAAVLAPLAKLLPTKEAGPAAPKLGDPYPMAATLGNGSGTIFMVSCTYRWREPDGLWMERYDAVPVRVWTSSL